MFLRLQISNNFIDRVVYCMGCGMISSKTKLFIVYNFLRDKKIIEPAVNQLLKYLPKDWQQGDWPIVIKHL